MFIISAIAVLVAVVIAPRIRLPGHQDAAELGWMSEQWLNEHRASRRA